MEHDSVQRVPTAFAHKLLMDAMTVYLLLQYRCKYHFVAS